MKKVKFITDFAVKRIGDVCLYDSQLASQLVNVDKVAEYTDDDVTLVNAEREHIEPQTSEATVHDITVVDVAKVATVNTKAKKDKK